MTTALYRRYRPESFQDVIGQEHVTEPLMTALRKNRVNHAYLFSGPRGCGKTTSARILARCLNCAQGPTATPCGHCDSCRDLARDGAGSLDVIEMDAASHGGVDHARDLRERATFAPVRDRFKIFIIDEAHMVTREGFNALLKIVEEPPEHVMFIFATTEPSKVLTTIRSRTHHYPFRLVPPEPLMRYLETLCEQEGVATEPGVLSLVVRAGGGSVRDSLSVLDQLMAGSGEHGITYDLAVALLGYTHAALLDDVVDAFAAGDSPTVFGAVDRVVQTGQDPRRFVEDLLERFRDLVVVNAVPEAAANILHGTPSDQINRLRNQASQLGAAELSRAADIINTALNEMTGATSPQLHLELLCARVLLPSADHSTRGITARVDRLERRLSIPRGAGIRQADPGTDSQAPTAQDHQGAPAERAHAPEPPVPADAAGTNTPPAAPAPLEPSAAAEAETRAAGGAPSTATTHPGERFEEPTDPQDGTEEPEGSAHPAASDPVPRSERPAGSDHPPADGRTGREEPSPASGDRQPISSPEHGDTTPARPNPGEPRDRPSDQAERERGAAPSARVSEPHEGAPAPAGEQNGDIDLLRASWTEIVSALAEIRRVAWTITMRGTPVSFAGQTLRIAFEAEGDLLNFPRFENDVRAAIHSVLGIDCRVEAVRPGDHHGGTGGGGARPGPSGPQGGPSGHARTPPPSPDDGGQHRAPRGEEPPEYFRDQEGFGAHRHRGGTPTSQDQPRGGPAAPPGSHGLADSGSRREREPLEPQQEQPERAADGPRVHEGPRGQAAPESAPEPSPDEPVTSWSVARIPQDGAAPATDTTPQPARTVPDAAASETAPTEAPLAREQASPARRDRPRHVVKTEAEYWTPDEAPPPPEDEPPADLYDFSPTPSPPAHTPPVAHPSQSTEAQPTHAPAAEAPVMGVAPRPSFRERHAAEIAAARQGAPMTAAEDVPAAPEDEDFTPSADDESIEDSSLYGRAAIERLLGGLLIEERPHQANQS